MAVASGAVGCAPRDGGGPGIEFVAVPGPDVLPRVIVCGNLASLLPRARGPSSLEAFLYGPIDTGGLNLRNPQGLALLDHWLLVCDQGRLTMTSIDLNDGRSRAWGDADHPPRCPVDVATDDAGRVYVADTTRRAVLVYEANQAFVEALTPEQEDSHASARFRPSSVLVHKGILYVGDIASQSVRRFDPASQSWLPPLRPPADAHPLIAPTGLAAAPDGTLLVADAVRGELRRLTPHGEWLAPISRPGRGPGELVRPKDVCCTKSGLIFVSDSGRQSVMVFDAAGRYLFEVDRTGRGDEGFTLPAGLTTVPAEALPGVAGRSPDAIEECVIVSDALGGTPLTMLGVVTQRG